MVCERNPLPAHVRYSLPCCIGRVLVGPERIFDGRELFTALAFEDNRAVRHLESIENESLELDAVVRCWLDSVAWKKLSYSTLT